MIKIAIKRLQNMDEEMSKVSSKIRKPKETEEKEQKKEKISEKQLKLANVRYKKWKWVILMQAIHRR